MILFNEGMPNFYSKRNTTTSVQDLCTIPREICPVYDLTGINSVETESNPQTDRPIAVMAEWSKQDLDLVS